MSTLCHFQNYYFTLIAITVSGITTVNLQTLETEFGLTSKETGLIMTGNDISALFLVTAVSFFGTKASKPKWMGIGSIITGKFCHQTLFFLYISAGYLLRAAS